LCQLDFLTGRADKGSCTSRFYGREIISCVTAIFPKEVFFIGKRTLFPREVQNVDYAVIEAFDIINQR
jgi:hypothetical protein